MIHPCDRSVHRAYSIYSLSLLFVRRSRWRNAEQEADVKPDDVNERGCLQQVLFGAPELFRKRGPQGTIRDTGSDRQLTRIPGHCTSSWIRLNIKSPAGAVSVLVHIITGCWTPGFTDPCYLFTPDSGFRRSVLPVHSWLPVSIDPCCLFTPDFRSPQISVACSLLTSGLHRSVLPVHSWLPVSTDQCCLFTPDFRSP